MFKSLNTQLFSIFSELGLGSLHSFLHSFSDSFIHSFRQAALLSHAGHCVDASRRRGEAQPYPQGRCHLMKGQKCVPVSGQASGTSPSKGTSWVWGGAEVEIKTSFSKEVTLGLRLVEPTEKEPDKIIWKIICKYTKEIISKNESFLITTRKR